MGLTVLDGRTQDLVASGVLPQLVKDPAAYRIEYTDGTRATLLLLNGAIMDYNIAARVAGQESSQPNSSCRRLPTLRILLAWPQKSSRRFTLEAQPFRWSERC